MTHLCFGFYMCVVETWVSTPNKTTTWRSQNRRLCFRRSSLAMPSSPARWTISCPKTLKVRHMKHQTDVVYCLWKKLWTTDNIDEPWISWPKLLKFYLLNNDWTIWYCSRGLVIHPYLWNFRRLHSEAVNLPQSVWQVGGSSASYTIYLLRVFDCSR